jgi:hypothetical protein
VTPRNLIWLDAEYCRQALSLLGAGRIAAVKDGVQDFGVQVRRRLHIFEAETTVGHPFRNRTNWFHLEFLLFLPLTLFLLDSSSLDIHMLASNAGLS